MTARKRLKEVYEKLQYNRYRGILDKGLYKYAEDLELFIKINKAKTFLNIDDSLDMYISIVHNEVYLINNKEVIDIAVENEHGNIYKDKDTIEYFHNEFKKDFFKFNYVWFKEYFKDLEI